MKKNIKINEESLKKIVKESVNKVLNESLYSDPVTKWVYWCLNYEQPEIFIAEISGGKESHLYQHYLSKFNNYYKVYGSYGVMNAFFVNLDREHQQKLLEYVENAQF